MGDIKVHLSNEKQAWTQDVNGVFYWTSAEPPTERVFCFACMADDTQVTAYISLEQVLTELKKLGIFHFDMPSLNQKPTKEAEP